MNYGFQPSPNDELLARELERALEPVGSDAYGMRCYIEVDGLYPGVRIRRITHYPDDVIDKIVRIAEDTHRKLFPSNK